MLCVLCVRTSEAFIHIFRDEGCALNISEVIVKHFWLQPKPNDVNANVICASCWEALNSFHKFYLQVEESHLRLQNAKAIDEDGLKLETEIAQVLNSPSVEPFTVVAAELLKEDIKEEVKEDTDAALPPGALSESERNLESAPDSTDFKNSLDHETLPACSTRSRITVEKVYAESDSSSNSKVDVKDYDTVSQNTPPAWHEQKSDIDDDDDDEDSDYEESSPKSKAKKNVPPKAAIKRLRQKKVEPKNPPCKKKRTTEEKSKKIDRIEYDELVAKNMKFSCDICSGTFTNFAILKRHYRSIHNECGYATCCGKKFRKRGVFVDHIYTHKNPEYFKCEKCGKVLANRNGLYCHMLTHDTEKRRTYQCDQCTMSFYRKPLLTRHLQTHISERNIKCPDCDKSFSTQDILRTHINNVHNAAYTRICDQCGKSFRRPDAFRKHQLEHDGITQPLVPCEKCSVKLTSKYGLKRHMESIHPETVIKYECSECGKIAPSASALQRHVSYVHKMERKLKCPMCDKAFKKTDGLKEHMSTHTGEVLYTCPHCPKTFNSNANMHSHRKKMHRKEWEENRRHPHMAAGSNAD